MSTAADFDVHQLAALVARLQHEHMSRSEVEGMVRTTQAFRAWGERPPSFQPRSRDTIVAEHREQWLRDAEAAVRVLDPRAFGSGSFHVIDGREIAMPKGTMGISIGAHLHELARDYLPRWARTPVAAVAVSVEAVARNTADFLCNAPQAAADKIRAAVSCIAAHEYAHHVVALVAGEQLPAGATIEGTIRSLTANGPDRPANSRAHGAPWCRAYAHLVMRAATMRHHAVWVERFRADVRAATAVNPDDVLDRLHPELVRFTSDDVLADVLRSPAPAGFQALFPDPKG
jgi:hypothetical protein